MRILLLALLLAGCASKGGLPSGIPPIPEFTASEERGRAFAYRRCGGCHNVGLDDTDPKDGPRFSALGRRYTPLSLQHRFAEVSEHGFDRMPPVTFTRAEAEDLLNYVVALGDRSGGSRDVP